jgi:hypothetical protein
MGYPVHTDSDRRRLPRAVGPCVGPPTPRRDNLRATKAAAAVAVVVDWLFEQRYSIGTADPIL